MDEVEARTLKLLLSLTEQHLSNAQVLTILMSAVSTVAHIDQRTMRGYAAAIRSLLEELEGKLESAVPTPEQAKRVVQSVASSGLTHNEMWAGALTLIRAAASQNDVNRFQVCDELKKLLQELSPS